MAEEKKLPKCCVRKCYRIYPLWYTAIPFVCLGVAIYCAYLGLGSKNTLITCSTVAAFAGICYLVTNIIGRYHLFLFIDANNVAHVHRATWWLTEPNPARHNAVLELWLGGWFRKSKIHGRFSRNWKSIRLQYNWIGAPKRITARDVTGSSITLPLTTFGGKWNIDYIKQLLLTLEKFPYVCSTLEQANEPKREQSAIAGKVGSAS
jgi:hypothetical protein